MITRIVSKNFETPDSHTLSVAKANGAYASIDKTFTQPAYVIETEISNSGLRGKGGGGAPAGAKWCLATRAQEMDQTSARSYLVVNADESEPGTFKDRQIIEFDPHLLIEGMILTCYAIGAHDAYIYIRGEYSFFADRLNAAIAEAYADGLLGKKVKGFDYRVDITVHRGAGAYICGEKSALLESLEGNRGHPRLKPHKPSPEYYFGEPTLVNNVETIATVPYIVNNGAAAYRQYGTEKSPGTLLFGLSGHINKPGIYEMAFGESMQDFIDTIGGGVRNGKKLKAVIPGGASTPVLTAEEVKTARLDYESMKAIGSALGTGGMIIMDEDTCMVSALKNLLSFYHHESCGQCTPCREGTAWVDGIISNMLNNKAKADDLELLSDISTTMNGKTICVFAPAVAMVIDGFLLRFRDEFEAYIQKAQETQMPEMVNITVDEQRVRAPEGAILLQVLIDNGISVPHFCYHEALGPDGNCRMCMVSIEGEKRPQISCDTRVKKEMVVYTKNESINDVKRSILELELLSHPVDCPICDQAGECSLQDYYMEFGLNASRRPKEEKKHKEKKLDIGRNIILDQERCVLCARCTRFTQEITHTNELTIIGRGNDARVSTLPGQPMHTEYAMNIIDLCPVGALTSKDFRFRQRVWFMHSAPGICHGCAKGCNIHIDHNQEKYKSDTIFRFRPRINKSINGHFICDAGRLSYKEENEERLDDFYHQNRRITQADALSYLLRYLHDEHTLFIVSPSLSTEELAVIQRLAQRFGIKMNAYHDAYIDPDFGDDWLRSADRAANLAAVKKLGIPTSKEELFIELARTKVVVNFDHKALCGNDAQTQKMLLNKTQIHFVSHLFVECKKHELLLPIASYSEQKGTLVNEDGVLQRFEAGLCNEKKNLLELLHIINATPKSVEGVWSEILQQPFGFGYEEIPTEGRRL